MPPPIPLAPNEIAVSIRALYVYPLKAARGIALTSATVERRGIAHDRRWMVVDASARAITQRTHPAMARVSVTLGEDELLLETPGASPLRVPIGEPPGRRLKVEIFDDICEAIAIGGGAAAWFQSLLGAPCELVYMPDSAIRAVDPRYAAPGDITGFSDGFPILVTAEASLADLNSRLDTAVPMSRFRPNIVVGGAPAWDEDRWMRISLGGGEPLNLNFDARRQAVRALRRHHGRSRQRRKPRPGAAQNIGVVSHAERQSDVRAEPRPRRGRDDTRRRRRYRRIVRVNLRVGRCRGVLQRGTSEG